MHVLGITGASGSIIGVRILEELLRSGAAAGVVVSSAGWKTLNFELYKNKKNITSMAALLEARGFSFDEAQLREFSNDDLFAPPASGTARVSAVIIAPASMKTLSAVANGYADSLITRAADVALKEGKKCVLVPRETPLSLIHLENMARVKRAGADIVPPMPAFYTFPESVDDIVDFIAGKVLNLLGIEHGLFKAWGD